jgi:hypothetical protein
MKLLELLEFIQERKIFKISQVDTSELADNELEIVKKELQKNLIEYQQDYFNRILSNAKSFSDDFYKRYLTSIYDNTNNEDEQQIIKVEIVENEAD